MNRLEVTERVERARAELAAAWPSCTVEARDVLDDRGVAAILVYARAEGRLIVAARAVELVPVDWQLTGGATVDACVGLLPASLTPTVGEVSAGLGVAW